MDMVFLWLWDGRREVRTGYSECHTNFPFFGNSEQTWAHRRECIRVSYAMEESVVRRGLEIITEGVAAASGA
jgi:alanine-alpha-ketoisovalerate/valine-pyruvate aminotransferase